MKNITKVQQIRDCYSSKKVPRTVIQHKKPRQPLTYFTLGFKLHAVGQVTQGRNWSEHITSLIPWNLSFRYVHCIGQFTPKMKANAEPRLLSSLVWIDSGIVVSQHRLESFFYEINVTEWWFSWNSWDEKWKNFCHWKLLTLGIYSRPLIGPYVLVVPFRGSCCIQSFFHNLENYKFFFYCGDSSKLPICAKSYYRAVMEHHPLNSGGVN